MKNLNLKIIKLPSHEIYNLNLIEQLCEKYEILSSCINRSCKMGRNNKDHQFRGFKKIILLHCVSSYPT